MQFNSYAFILAFFPILFAGYFLLNRISDTVGKIYIVTASAVFYFIGGGGQSSVFLVASTIVNYAASRTIVRTYRRSKCALIADIIANILLLFYFKYNNFFMQNLGNALETAYTIKDIALPLGISFFTFQQIMYVVNVYHGDIEDVNALDYLVYILFFPKLIMGPLVEPEMLISQFNDHGRKRVNWDHVAWGLKIFSFGLFKKMVLADTFAEAVTWGYANLDAATSMDWLLIMLAYTFEIYFDFSGYSDMAVGASKMLNIDLPQNFDSPYQALSIRDFWKRWHISLTGFLTKYIYIPLGGSREGKIRTYINTMIVFLVSGFWHGANWTFVLWGALHGLLCIFDRLFDRRKEQLFSPIRWGVTFFAINILWLLFRSDSIAQWLGLIYKTFTFQNMAVSDGLINSFILPETPLLLKLLHLRRMNAAVRGFSMLMFFLSAFGICTIPANNYRRLERNNWATMVFAAIAFVWGFLCLSNESVFVYFNF